MRASSWPRGPSARSEVQYYQLENDGAGRLLLRTLREAAGRGVKVRVLVDDLYTVKSQQLLLALSETPNVEVRLFNPFCCGRNGFLVALRGVAVGDLRDSTTACTTSSSLPTA